MDLIECRTCYRMFPNTDDTGVCPVGHENDWATDEFDDFIPARKVVG